MRKLVVTLEIPDSPCDGPLLPFDPLELRAPLFRHAAQCTQWPIATFSVAGERVRLFHSDTVLGFEMESGENWAVSLSDLARHAASAVAPIHIGSFPPAEASTDHPQPRGV